MKRLILCAGVFIGLLNTAEAQTKKAASNKSQAAAKSSSTNKNTKKLESTSAYEAKAPALPKSSLGWQNTPATTNSFRINDPIIRTLNAKAHGANVPIDFKEFLGVGRGAYGIANGRIMLRPTGSTTSGGITGSGSIATGSTPASAGIHATVPTVNGKNPYAGPGMWGTTGVGIGTDFRRNEISLRTLPLRDPNH